MGKPAIPSPAEIVGAGMVELYKTRPNAFPLLNYGEGAYAAVFEGLKAQAALAVGRIADGVKGSNLSLARGDQLKAYVASEYDIPPDLTAQKSVGTVVLTRSTGSLAAGAIKKGHRFRREAEPLAVIPITAAEYEAITDVPVLQGQTSVTVSLVAVRAGKDTSTPYLTSSPFKPLVATDALFDKAFTVASYTMGGGSDGFTDDDIERYARAYALGKSGPNNDSLLLAAYRTGVKHLLVSDTTSTLYVADSAWGGSQLWLDSTKRQMHDGNFIGHGCKISLQLVPNVVINVTLTVRLRDTAYLSDPADITTAIHTAVRSYFDDRSDFNVYGTQQLRGVVSRADKRILRCTAASINKLDGSVQSYTSPSFSHLYLTDNAVNISYLGPV